jgi:hypothetical protein
MRGKPQVEAAFKTIRSSFSQHIAGYKGYKVDQRGRQAEMHARWTLSDIEFFFAEYIISVAHFLDCTRKDGLATNNHVKFLAGCSGVTIIATGVEMEDSALLDEGTGDPRKKQTAGRFSLHQFTPFAIDTPEEAKEWIGVVQGLEQALALYHHQPGSLARHHWRYLHGRTLGRMAPLADIIKQSAGLAISRGQETGREEITRELMEEIVLDHWSTLEYDELKEVRARKARSDRQRGKAGGKAARA